MTQQDTQLIGLQYDGNNSPTVSSKAEGFAAETLIEMARQQGIYIHQDPELLEKLAHLETGDGIPPALFVIIAELLAYAYLLQGKYPEQWRRSDGSIAIQTTV